MAMDRPRPGAVDRPRDTAGKGGKDRGGRRSWWRSIASPQDPLRHLGPVEDDRERELPSSGMRAVYIALALLVIASVVLSLLFDDLELVERFGPNLATDTFGILITLVFVQRVLERQERARRLRGSVGALRKGARALSSLARVWADLVKGSSRWNTATPPQALDELFAAHMTKNLNECALAARREEDGRAEQSWVEWAADRITASRDALRDVVFAYGGSMDAAYVEVLDELIDDPFLSFMVELPRDGSDPRTWRAKLNKARALREVHFRRLLTAIELHNELAGEAAKVRSRRTAPRTGSIGVELPLDYDLRVHVPLDGEWWRSPPRPGTLRVDSTS